MIVGYSTLKGKKINLLAEQIVGILKVEKKFFPQEMW